jgi:two-component system chemotaxis sensor kinase CheA
MDVVRSNVEKIGGAIELSSTEGIGSQFTIRIPLTLAIISALIVECCGERFAMPQSSVVELVSANEAAPHKIEFIEGAAVLRLRDRLLPLLFLHNLLDLDTAKLCGDETCVVAARIGGFTFGVVVDQVFDTEEIVVKPMASVLRHLKLYAGATILGDGAIIPILDFKGISLEAGVSQSVGRAQDEAAGWGLVQPMTSVLLYRTQSGALKGAPLEQVARIEEIGADQIERVDGRTVIQYRGKLMPVLSADADGPVAWSGDDRRPLLVFTRGERVLGLLARDIVDIVECATTVELSASGAGAAGSLIIAGAATELIDLDYYWRSIGLDQPPTREVEAASTRVAGMATTVARRLLLIDESPFSRLLLSPLLGQAGYSVTVASEAGAALALHDAGETFQLIMADITSKGENARKLVAALASATAWHDTPVLGLGLANAGANSGSIDQVTVLEAISESMGKSRKVA